MQSLLRLVLINLSIFMALVTGCDEKDSDCIESLPSFIIGDNAYPRVIAGAESVVKIEISVPVEKHQLSRQQNHSYRRPNLGKSHD